MENEEDQSTPERFAPGTMDHVLSGIESPEIREKILRIAHEAGVRKEDPVWTLILLILDAQDSKTWAGQAAQAAGEAADRIRDEIRGLPGAVSAGAIDGAEKAKKALEAAIVAAMRQSAGDIAAQGRELRGQVQSALSAFVPALKDKEDEVVKTWRANLAAAAKADRAGTETKWMWIGLVTALFLLLAGGAGGWVIGTQGVIK